MTHENPTALIDEMTDLLDAEHAALKAGDFDRITSHVDQKERLLHKISVAHGEDATHLSHLHEKLSRNQTLLDATLQGLRRVSKKLSELGGIRGHLETYGEDGRRRKVEGHITHKVEKRA